MRREPCRDRGNEHGQRRVDRGESRHQERPCEPAGVPGRRQQPCERGPAAGWCRGQRRGLDRWELEPEPDPGHRQRREGRGGDRRRDGGVEGGDPDPCDGEAETDHRRVTEPIGQDPTERRGEGSGDRQRRERQGRGGTGSCEQEEGQADEEDVQDHAVQHVQTGGSDEPAVRQLRESCRPDRRRGPWRSRTAGDRYPSERPDARDRRQARYDEGGHEHPTPAHAADQHRTNERTDGRHRVRDRRQDPEPTPATGRSLGQTGVDGRLGHGDPDRLDGPGHEQHGEARAHRRQQGAGGEDAESAADRPAQPDPIRQRPGDGLHHGLDREERRDDPGGCGHRCMEIGGDRRERDHEHRAREHRQARRRGQRRHDPRPCRPCGPGTPHGDAPAVQPDDPVDTTLRKRPDHSLRSDYGGGHGPGGS